MAGINLYWNYNFNIRINLEMNSTLGTCSFWFAFSRAVGRSFFTFKYSLLMLRYSVKLKLFGYSPPIIPKTLKRTLPITCSVFWRTKKTGINLYWNYNFNISIKFERNSLGTRSSLFAFSKTVWRSFIHFQLRFVNTRLLWLNLMLFGSSEKELLCSSKLSTEESKLEWTRE